MGPASSRPKPYPPPPTRTHPPPTTTITTQGDGAGVNLAASPFMLLFLLIHVSTPPILPPPCTRVMALLNLAASPFMLLFLLIYFFMKNAERFYHHPSTIGGPARGLGAVVHAVDASHAVKPPRVLQGGGRRGRPWAHCPPTCRSAGWGEPFEGCHQASAC